MTIFKGCRDDNWRLCSAAEANFCMPMQNMNALRNLPEQYQTDWLKSTGAIVRRLGLLDERM